MIHFKLSMSSGKPVLSGKILNTSMKNNKYRNLMWVEPIKCNGKVIPKNKRDTICISTFNLVPERS